VNRPQSAGPGGRERADRRDLAAGRAGEGEPELAGAGPAEDLADADPAEDPAGADPAGAVAMVAGFGRWTRFPAQIRV
jgi:hypothetical protein